MIILLCNFLGFALFTKIESATIKKQHGRFFKNTIKYKDEVRDPKTWIKVLNLSCLLIGQWQLTNCYYYWLIRFTTLRAILRHFQRQKTNGNEPLI
jgi:hypothetical protein